MSVIRLIRRPSSASGKPDTGSVALVISMRCRSNAVPYVIPANADPTEVARTVLMAVRRVMGMLCGLQSTVYGLWSHQPRVYGQGRRAPGAKGQPEPRAWASETI